MKKRISFTLSADEVAIIEKAGSIVPRLCNPLPIVESWLAARAILAVAKAIVRQEYLSLPITADLRGMTPEERAELHSPRQGPRWKRSGDIWLIE